jgi:uncharacterized protein (TIGR01319 family)
MKLLCVDIGSTWTKGGLFLQDGAGELRLHERASRPTTVADLSDGFFRVQRDLDPDRSADALHYSSSAKGGLKVAALGIVPEITSEMARIAAHSAGARLSRVYSYSLTAADVAELERDPPDILLFAGGTDGGNAGFVRANAAALAASELDCPIVYAGNRAVRQEITALLQGRQLIVVDNVMPEMDRPNPEPARAALREVFLSRIVAGKGLDAIVAETGVEPVPTPYAVYDYVGLIQAHVPGWEEFMVVDLGGATTDVYSCHRERPASGTVQRGLPEPLLKRTVEGDLGLRVSAGAAVAAAPELLRGALEGDDGRAAEFAARAEVVAANPDILPDDDAGRAFDGVVAGTCLAAACRRHAGRMHPVSTADGLVNVQVGRDLSRVSRIIGTGGYLAASGGFRPAEWLSRIAVDAQGRRVLVPEAVDYHRDASYLFPLLANAARGCPEAAARAGVRHLRSTTEFAA